MIKINLVGEGRRPVAVRAKAVETAGIDRKADIALIVLGAIGLLVALGHFFWLRHEIGVMDDDIAAAEEEVERLAPIIREVEEFKAKKAVLENKIQVINDLRANQRGPVRIMDYISTALPDLLWLTRMDVNRSTIKLTGQAFNTNAVATFIEGLDEVEEFAEPVLKDTQRARRGDYYQFSVDVPYSFTRPVQQGVDGAGDGEAE